jgi:hypothetical protein
VVADTKELCTVPHDIALPVLFIRDRPRWGDFNPDLKFKDVPGILPTKFLPDSIHF